MWLNLFENISYIPHTKKKEKNDAVGIVVYVVFVLG